MLKKLLISHKISIKKAFLFSLISIIFVFSIGCSNKASNTDVKNNSTSSNSTNKPLTESKNYLNSNINTYNDFILGIAQDFKMSETTINFLNENPTLFPSKTDNDLQKLKSMIDYSVGYKHLDKSLSSYLNKVINIYGTIQEIKEIPLNGQTITFMQVVTESNESYLAIYLGNLTNLFKDCTVTVTSLPVTSLSVKNDFGGNTNSVVVIVGYLENLGEGAPIDGVQ